MTLTKRQKEVLDFLVSFHNKHGYSPSFEEIARSLKLTSLATVHKHITTLERKGFVRRGYNQSRSIEVMQLPKQVREQVHDRNSAIELPMMGRIAAGRPLEAVQDNETLSLGEFARSDKTFVLQVRGSSMIDDHILNGDYVVIEPTQVANPGRNRRRAGEQRRSHIETLLSRAGRKDSPATREFGNGAHHGSGK